MEKYPDSCDSSKFIFSGAIAIIVLQFAVAITVGLCGYGYSLWGCSVANEPSPAEGIDIASLEFVFYMSITLVIEEIVFRLLPLGLTTWIFGTKGIWKKYEVYPSAYLLVMLVSSLAFGLPYGDGAVEAFVQTMRSLILCIVFAKCGGLQDDYVEAFRSSACANLMSAAVLCAIIYVTIGHYV